MKNIRAVDHGTHAEVHMLVPRTRFARFLLWACPGLVRRIDTLLSEAP